MVRRKDGTKSYLPSSSLLTYLGLSHGQSKVTLHPFVFTDGRRLQKLARLARPTRVRMMQRTIPEDWVHDTGRLVLVGSAAHPYPV
jgi:2-polyprenyl-6-methoxyphenol hydroxylase-like FAD-dependent oxidoreductase